MLERFDCVFFPLVLRLEAERDGEEGEKTLLFNVISICRLSRASRSSAFA